MKFTVFKFNKSFLKLLIFQSLYPVRVKDGRLYSFLIPFLFLFYFYF